MSKKWPMVALGDILIERQETPDPAALLSGEIPILSKIGFDNGRIELREGGETNTKMILIKPGDFVISGINAAKGAIAIYEKINKLPIAATIHYGAYRPIEEKVDIHFLWWLLRSRIFRDILIEAVPGGIKTELKAKRLLGVRIPLPVLAEQQRIVKNIAEMAVRIANGQSICNQVSAEAEALKISIHANLADKRTKKIGEILRLEEYHELISSEGSYPQVGVKSFGGGLFPKMAVEGSGTTYHTFNRLYEGAIILSQVKGWEGAIAVCPPELAGWFVSPEYRTFRCIPTEARPGYLASLVKTEWFWNKLSSATRGVGARRERTRPEQFLDIELLMPNLDQQKQGEILLAQVDTLLKQQIEALEVLEALRSAMLDRAFKGEL